MPSTAISTRRFCRFLAQSLAVCILVFGISHHALAGDERIICLNANAMEVLRILGATGDVVGVNSHILRDRSFWSALASLPDMGDWREPDYEAIIALRPTLVFCYRANPGPEAERMLEPRGIRVVRLDFYRPDTFKTEFAEVGRLLGRTTEADRFMAWFIPARERIRAIVAASPERPNIYPEGYSDYRVAGGRSGLGTLCAEAGLTNIAADMERESALVTTEWVASRAPAAIIKNIPRTGDYDWTDASRLHAAAQSLKSRPGWEHVEAAAERRIFCITSSVTSGPGLVVGLAHLVRRFHPSATDLDSEALHREYMERFHGIPARGVYVYDDRAAR